MLNTMPLAQISTVTYLHCIHKRLGSLDEDRRQEHTSFRLDYTFPLSHVVTGCPDIQDPTPTSAELLLTSSLPHAVPAPRFQWSAASRTADGSRGQARHRPALAAEARMCALPCSCRPCRRSNSSAAHHVRSCDDRRRRLPCVARLPPRQLAPPKTSC